MLTCHIYLNENVLKSLIKGTERLIVKKQPVTFCLQKTHFFKDTCRLQVRRQKKIFYANGNPKE